MSTTTAKISTPEILQSDAVKGAVAHVNIPREKIQEVMHSAIDEVLKAIQAQGQQPAGPLFCYHLRTSSTEFDFEVGFPVSKPIQPGGRVAMSGLPASRVARTIYRGPYEGLFGAWTEFSAWMQREGHKGTGKVWERYVKGPESGADPTQWETELNIPLAN
jgi:effector-binding domain-containing protein